MGDFAAAEHRAVVGRLAAWPGIRCYLVGPEFEAVVSGTENERRAYPSAEALAEALKSGEVVIRDAHVLVKGSRGIALEKLYPLL